MLFVWRALQAWSNVWHCGICFNHTVEWQLPLVGTGFLYCHVKKKKKDSLALYSALYSELSFEIHIKNPGLVLHEEVQTPRNNKSPRPGRPCDYSCFSGTVEPLTKHSPSFLTCYIIYWIMAVLDNFCQFLWFPWF